MEYEYLFTKGLHERLKEKIKGKIFCKVINDILVVNIHTKEGLDYGFTLDNFARELQVGGLAAESVMDMIVNEYRREVLKRFFF